MLLQLHLNDAVLFGLTLNVKSNGSYSQIIEYTLELIGDMGRMKSVENNGP